MKPSAPLALSALLSLAIAQPMIEKRDDGTVTVTDMVVVTTDVTITLGGPSTAPVAAPTAHANHIAYHAQGKAEAQAQPPPSSAPAPVQQAAPQEKDAAPPAAPSTPAAQAAPSAGSSPEQIQEAEDSKQEAINDAQKQADFAHQSQMIAQQNGGASAAPAAPANPPASPAPQAPAQSPASPAPAGGSGGGSGGSSGQTYSGDVTIYNDQGIGACGWSNDTNSEDFFALAHGMLSLQENDMNNPN